MPIPSGPILEDPQAATEPVRTYWVDDLFVVEWDVLDSAGQPAPGAAVAATVALPDATEAAMTVTSAANTYTATHLITVPGRHGWKLVATGAATGAVEGDFTARRDLVGLPPVELDPATSTGMMRLLTTDRDETEPLLEDADYAALLAAEGGSVKRAAAAALDTIARSEVLVGKKIRTQDLQTDGPAVAAELRASAKALREQAAEVDETGEAWGLDIVDYDQWAAYR